jgi:hypothetical protein
MSHHSNVVSVLDTPTKPQLPVSAGDRDTVRCAILQKWGCAPLPVLTDECVSSLVQATTCRPVMGDLGVVVGFLNNIRCTFRFAGDG